MDPFRNLRTPRTGAFRRYVAVDVLNFTGITKEEVEEIDAILENGEFFAQEKDDQEPNLFLMAPRNSIVGKLVAAGEGKNDAGYVIMYPFFSSHLSLPVKPGEQVWGFSEPNGKVFWVSRIHEPDHVEDLNYTHGDRRNLPTTEKIVGLVGADEKAKFSKTPGFPNGDSLENRETDLEDFEKATNESLEKKGIDSNKFRLPKINSYEKIVEEAKSKEQIVYEPVPRFTKRPGDLSIHGSNNSSITLGTERGYSIPVVVAGTSNADPSSDSASSQGLSEGMGAIDIVVGRGRIHDGSAANDGKDPINTRPRVVKNTREKYETDKNIGLDKSKAPDGSALADTGEGDPDMENDSSRIYMSMKTNPDALFNLSYPLAGEAPLDPIEETPNSAAVVVKSDQIRIIARKDEANQINGDVRIIKEGAEDSDRAVIVLKSDGTIMIDGPRIVIGSGIEKAHGAGDQVIIGRDASQSVVLGDKLGELLVKFLGSIVTNQAAISVGAGPNVLNPDVAAKAAEILAELGGTPAGVHTPANNKTLSKVAKTK